MALLSFSKDTRAAQIRACCDTIKEAADRIVNMSELDRNVEIRIILACKEVPVIVVEKEFYSRECIDVLQRG